MQQELFDCLAGARSLQELRWVEPKALVIRRKYFEGLESVDVGELTIHRRVSRISYSRRCAEASAIQAYSRQGITLALGMKIGYVVKDASKLNVELARNALRFDAEYYGNLLEKAWTEVAFVFAHNLKDK